jgi:TonB family protein
LLALEGIRTEAPQVSVFLPAPDSGVPSRDVVLTVGKPQWHAQFFSSLKVLLKDPRPPRKFQGEPFFRHCWIEGHFPRRAFAAATSLQVLLVLFPPPIWTARPPRISEPSREMELTWFGPVQDLPPLSPSTLHLRPVAKTAASKPANHPGADAFHLRQTIVSEPMRPAHPRQTLIQPSSPPEPPKILPELPNIVQLARSEPLRPKVELQEMKPKPASHLAVSDETIPAVPIPAKQPGPLDIAPSLRDPAKPALPVTPMSAPRTAASRPASNFSAPEIAPSGVASATIVALSAAPSPVPPPPAMPAGNLSARISISPDGPQAGSPDTNQASDGGRGPMGIFISPGNRDKASPVSGLGIDTAAKGSGSPVISRILPRIHPLPEDASSHALDSGAPRQMTKLDMPPEKILGAKQVYTLHVNLPNMTSASGSWVLNFAELNADESPANGVIGTGELNGPVPFRKVDPKYPPELRSSHVEGEVILYAIIRKDGSVDSIQLVHGVDPRLDANAMEALAQWKFRPAEKQGSPVDLEAVVHIPFRSRSPVY